MTLIKYGTTFGFNWYINLFEFSSVILILPSFYCYCWHDLRVMTPVRAEVLGSSSCSDHWTSYEITIIENMNTSTGFMHKIEYYFSVLIHFLQGSLNDVFVENMFWISDFWHTMGIPSLHKHLRLPCWNSLY